MVPERERMSLSLPSKEDILNFVVAHPRLMTFMVGMGITISFSLIGRLTLEHTHMAFAQGHFDGQFPEKFPIDKVPKDTLATAALASCANCVEQIPGLNKTS